MNSACICLITVDPEQVPVFLFLPYTFQRTVSDWASSCSSVGLLLGFIVYSRDRYSVFPKSDSVSHRIIYLGNKKCNRRLSKYTPYRVPFNEKDGTFIFSLTFGQVYRVICLAGVLSARSRHGLTVRYVSSDSPTKSTRASVDCIIIIRQQIELQIVTKHSQNAYCSCTSKRKHYEPFAGSIVYAASTSTTTAATAAT